MSGFRGEISRAGACPELVEGAPAAHDLFHAVLTS